MKKSIKIILIIIGILLVLIVLGNLNKNPKPEYSSWKDVRANDVAVVSSEWKTPQWLDINSTGWEDGPFISFDGKTLYFTYINVDLLNGNKVSGPDRDSIGICGKYLHCGQFPRPDVFYSIKDSKGWTSPVPHLLTTKFPIGGFFLQNENEAYFHKHNEKTLTDIYFVEKINEQWGEPQKIEEISSDFNDDDPWVSSNNNEIYFWSKRPGSLGGDNIYHSTKVNDKWQAPMMLPEPINSNSNDLQPFLYGDMIYFSSDRDGVIKIYKSQKQGSNWNQPEVVVSSKYGVGEPTLTSNGKYLYFMQIFKNDKGVFNPDLMYVEVKGN